MGFEQSIETWRFVRNFSTFGDFKKREYFTDYFLEKIRQMIKKNRLKITLKMLVQEPPFIP
jgi:hypothetical protein